MPAHECFFLLCATLVACGGQVAADDDLSDADTTHDGATDGSMEAGDAHPLPDASFAIDAGVSCTGGEMSSEQTDAACSTVMSYACGDSTFTISCNCPDETCQCQSQSPTTSSAEVVSVPSLCPGCGFTREEFAAICGFPN